MIKKNIKLTAGLVLLALSSCVTENEPDGSASLTVGDRLPEFEVTTNSGNIISTSSFEGRIGFIIFFNTSCSDCRNELPIVQEIYEKYRDNDEVLICAIAREEDEDSIESYWKQNNLTIPWSPQTNREVYNLFAQSIIPRIYISDRNEIIKYIYIDSDKPDFSVLESSIENLLAN